MTGSRSAQDVQTTVLPWGVAKWLITADQGAAMSLGEVIVLPGQSHEWHVHEGSDEVVYVLAGYGAFTVGEGNRIPIGPGDALHIPAGVFHDSHNQGWAPLHLLVMYSPVGPELAEPVAEYEMVPAGGPLVMSTSVGAAEEGGSAAGN
jgi:quercetin dioxygenase-like cupin family protein